eukprot:TRINITY_DN2555_c0_g1_i9.p1 TRINITY_DN2555_c0_g1~~TRINITY_DN2555_c0_g1_i9.p1  ORF type:complete len:492 (+),score=83.47 TRINITY_DN2555_c0_g1_i9:1030-2505(+)
MLIDGAGGGAGGGDRDGPPSGGGGPTSPSARGTADGPGDAPPSPQPLRSPSAAPLPSGPPAGSADDLALPRRDAMSLEPPPTGAGDAHGGVPKRVAVGRRGSRALSAASHVVVVRARRQIAAFLKSHRADEVVPDESLVVIVERGLVLKRAFLALREHGIRAAAVLDSREDRLIGVITVSDFMNVFCDLHESDPDGEPNVALAHMTIAQWKVKDRGNDGSRSGLICANAEASLYDACCTLRDKRVHRLPIVDSPSNGSLMMLNHWIVLRFVYEHLQPRSRPGVTLAGASGRQGDGDQVRTRPGASPASGTDGPNGVWDHMHGDPSAGGGPNGGTVDRDPSGAAAAESSGHVSDLFDLTVSALGLGTFGGIMSVTEAMPLVSVLQLLSEQHLSALPVVSPTGALINVFARVDVRELATDDRQPLNLRERLGDVLHRLRPAGFQVATCCAGDSVRVLFTRFDAARKHRLYCVDDGGQLLGVVSLSDVLRYFLE